MILQRLSVQEGAEEAVALGDGGLVELVAAFLAGAGLEGGDIFVERIVGGDNLHIMIGVAEIYPCVGIGFQIDIHHIDAFFRRMLQRMMQGA